MLGIGGLMLLDLALVSVAFHIAVSLQPSVTTVLPGSIAWPMKPCNVARSVSTMCRNRMRPMPFPSA